MTDIPERLARRPRDARGYPIPVTVTMKEDGSPDFRVTSMSAWSRVVRLRLCALCGEPLGSHLAFIGGELCHINRLFTDPPMHLECAHYAVRVCPFLAAPRMHYAVKLPEIAGHLVAVNPGVSDHRPERFMLATTRRYQVINHPKVGLCIQAGPWDQCPVVEGGYPAMSQDNNNPREPWDGKSPLHLGTLGPGESVEVPITAELAARIVEQAESAHFKFMAEMAVLNAVHAARTRAAMVDFWVVVAVCFTTVGVAAINAYVWHSEAVRYTCMAICLIIMIRSLYQAATLTKRTRRAYGLDKDGKP